MQIKLASVKLAMRYMKRVSSELEAIGGGSFEEEELILQGVRFAFRVHQVINNFLNEVSMHVRKEAKILNKRFSSLHFF